MVNRHPRYSTGCERLLTQVAEFYVANRGEMAAEVVIAWTERFNPRHTMSPTLDWIQYFDGSARFRFAFLGSESYTEISQSLSESNWHH